MSGSRLASWHSTGSGPGTLKTVTSDQQTGQVTVSMKPTAEESDAGTYSFADIEAKWLPVWEQLNTFTPVDDGSRERR